MIGEDYKPTTFWRFLLEKGKLDMGRTIFALILTILSIVYTQDVLDSGAKWEKYLLVSTYLILVASTLASIYLPYTIFKKLKK
jgi:uncharacterized membrane protein YobD (UPF0266 family)